MADEDPMGAFGDPTEDGTQILSGGFHVSFRDGFNEDTRHTVVIMYVAVDDKTVGFALRPDQADLLAAELQRVAQVARENQFDRG